MVMSFECQKVVKKYKYLMKNTFEIERCLYKMDHVSLLKFYKNNGDDIDKLIWHCDNSLGPIFDFDIDFCAIEKTYKYLTTKYLDMCFNYVDIEAFVDISYFNLDYISDICKKIKVKNLWYLRKVLLNKKHEYDEISSYKRIKNFDVGINRESEMCIYTYGKIISELEKYVV